MLEDLNKEQRELAKYMCELSEIAFTAGWVDNLEFGLYKIMNEESERFGRLESSPQIVDRLKVLSSKAGGWIVFDEAKEETFVNWEKWKEIAASNNS